MNSAVKLAAVPVSPEPGDLLPQQLAEWLKVKPSWIFEQTRQRAKTRNKNPLPCLRLGKYVRFSRRQVTEWLRGMRRNAGRPKIAATERRQIVARFLVTKEEMGLRLTVSEYLRAVSIPK
jgi:hypothetical protein